MTEFSCPEARALVSDYIDGELPPEVARSLEAHLESCRYCPPLYASLVETLAELKALDDSAGVDRLVARVVTALAADSGHPDQPNRSDS